MGISTSMQVLESIESLRNKWADHDKAIERIYGDASPAVGALRMCIGDLYDCMRMQLSSKEEWDEWQEHESGRYKA